MCRMNRFQTSASKRRFRRRRRRRRRRSVTRINVVFLGYFFLKVAVVVVLPQPIFCLSLVFLRPEINYF